MAGRDLRAVVLGNLALGVMRLAGFGLRTKCYGLDEAMALEAPKIFCGWHGRSTIYALHFRKRGHWVIISQSRDGEIQKRVYEGLGYRIIRGSSKRGGAQAAIEGIRALREGGVMALTPDGPRGPVRVVKPGAVTMAQKSGAVLIPVGLDAKPRFVVKSAWDDYLFPIPFGRAVMTFGEPITVPADANEEQFEEARARLESAIMQVQADAEARLRG